MAGRLDGRVAIVTGAANGIGSAVVARFRAEGARVIANDIDAARLASEHEPGADLHTLAIDIADQAAPDRLVQAAIETFGGLDILANNAGICPYVVVEEMDDTIWDRVIGVNLTAMFRLTRRAIPELRRSKAGRIINTSSILGQQSSPEVAAYSSSKHAVAGLTKTLAIELGPDRITVNHILPGATLTGITRDLIDGKPELRKAYDEMGVLGRMAEPADIANAFLFLASDEASFVTGHGLAIDGGALARI